MNEIACLIKRGKERIFLSLNNTYYFAHVDTYGFEDLLVWTYLLLRQISNFQILVFQQAYEYKKDLELYKFHYNVIPLEMSQEYKLVAEIWILFFLVFVILWLFPLKRV